MKKYSQTHEWVEIEGEIASIGISQHAQILLGTIAFVELPPVGTEVKQGEALGVIESVKSASDFYAPVSGVVVEVNEGLVAYPEALNGQAEYHWLVKLRLCAPQEINGLMTAETYSECLSQI